MNHETEVVRYRTQRWVEEVVIGLNLCPFAKAVANDMAIEVHEGSDVTELTAAFSAFVSEFNEACEIETPTALFVVPNALDDFLDYNDYLHIADTILCDHGLEGVLQIASFHPRYRFAGAEPHDPANYTNRSPYPMFHILREAHVSAAVDRFPDTSTIPDTNVRLLRQMGTDALRELMARGLSTPSCGGHKPS